MKNSLKVSVNWQPTGDEPSPLWKTLMRILLNKKRTLPEQAPGENKLTGGAEEGRPHKLE